MLLISACRLVMLYICAEFHEMILNGIKVIERTRFNYLKRYQSYRADTISIQKITKGNNSAKNVGGVTVVNLCMSSGHALYFYQVL